MGTSRTFSILFWLNLAKEKDGFAPIYARITVDGKRAEISLKRKTKLPYGIRRPVKPLPGPPKGSN